jgi:hypothetical protein
VIIIVIYTLAYLLWGIKVFYLRLLDFFAILLDKRCG